MWQKIEWPGGKKICATFTVALEAYQKAGHFKTLEVPGPNLFSLSHNEYGGNVGIWRIMEIFARHGITGATIDVNGLAVEKWPDAIRALHSAGHELAGHGYTNEVKMTSLDAEQQRSEIRRVTKIIQGAIGVRPVGWVSPGGNHTEATIGILADEGYTWCGDRCDRDLPYTTSTNGKPICIIPKHWYFNDLRAWNGGGLSGAEAFDAFRYSFDFVLEEARRGRPGRIDALVHAELGGRPYIAQAYEKMVAYCKLHETDIWFASRRDIADYVLQNGLK